MFLAFFNKKRRCHSSTRNNKKRRYRLKLDNSLARKKAGGRRREDSTQENKIWCWMLLVRRTDTDAFTHRSFYAQKLLHKGAFTQRSFYTERLLDTEAFTHRGWNVISPHFIPGTVSIGAAQSFCKGCISSLPPSQTMTEQKPVRHVFCDCFDWSSLPFWVFFTDHTLAHPLVG